MNPGFNKFLMRLRMESREEENRCKPPIDSPDIVQTADYVFARFSEPEGDSGRLLVAKQKSNRKVQYLVKHEYTDCACNEFVYTKLAQAMGYCMPDAVLFQLSTGEKRTYFKTEYIIGERLLNVVNAAPTYAEIREKAENWQQYFCFYGLYAMLLESDGLEVLLADDHRIYRVDTTDAFLISNLELDQAAIRHEFNGSIPYEAIIKHLLSLNFDRVFDRDNCERILSGCLATDSKCLSFFLEPFQRIHEISDDYIDNFLNTLCYFYPDYIGEYFKRYLATLKKHCAIYYKEKIGE